MCEAILFSGQNSAYDDSAILRNAANGIEIYQANLYAVKMPIATTIYSLG